MRYGANGRTIRRRLMRTCVTSPYMSRAYLSLRIPFSVFPSPPPPFAPPGIRECDDMFVDREKGRRYIFSQAYGKRPDLDDTARLVEPVGETPGDYTWFSGDVLVYSPGHDLDEASPTGREPVDDALLAAWRDRRQWLSRYLTYCDFPGPVATAMAWVRNYAIDSYREIEGDSAVVTYAVKWFRPERTLRFCASVRRLIKAAGRAGCRIELIK